MIVDTNTYYNRQAPACETRTLSPFEWSVEYAAQKNSLVNNEKGLLWRKVEEEKKRTRREYNMRQLLA